MIYNYKSIPTQEYEFDCIEELVRDIINQFENSLRRDEYLSIHAYPDMIRAITDELTFYSNDFGNLTYDKDYNWNLLYSNEDIPLIFCITADGRLGIEESRCANGSYKFDTPTILYWSDRLKHKDLRMFEKENINVLVFSVYDAEDEMNSDF